MKVSDVKKRVGKLLDGKVSEVVEWIHKSGHAAVPAGHLGDKSGMKVAQVADARPAAVKAREANAGRRGKPANRRWR
jgi:hypothetical protein